MAVEIRSLCWGGCSFGSRGKPKGKKIRRAFSEAPEMRHTPLESKIGEAKMMGQPTWSLLLTPGKRGHDPFILFNDQPFLKRQKETPGTPKKRDSAHVNHFLIEVSRRLQQLTTHLDFQGEKWNSGSNRASKAQSFLVPSTNKK